MKEGQPKPIEFQQLKPKEQIIYQAPKPLLKDTSYLLRRNMRRISRTGK